MDVPWNYELTGDQRANPVVYATRIDLGSRYRCPTDEELKSVFLTEQFNLQTWGRAKDPSGRDILINDPHWIAVRGGTPLHIDPKYPRYSHHLKLRVDDEIYVRGLNKEEMQLERGTFYILDTHSPHQVFAKGKANAHGWDVAVSIDSPVILPWEKALQFCKMYALTADLIPR